MSGSIAAAWLFGALAAAGPPRGSLLPEADDFAPPPAERGWRQILSVPRVGGRIWSVTVDPEDPHRIFVGTEAGSVLITHDGGVTWNEVDVDARVIQERSAGLPAPGLPRLGKVTKSNFRAFVDPPHRDAVDRISISSVANPFPVKPPFFWAGFLATAPKFRPNLLGPILKSRVWKTQPIKRIALCPGGRYEVVVASSDAVYGSQDGGLTYVRLFANAGRVFLDHAICSPADPNHISVATNIGLFLSTDGGLTFDQDLTAWPGKKSTAVAYAPPRYEGEVFLFSASGSELFAGNPETETGLVGIYPTDASTAPWRTIRWIAADEDGGIYLATDDGARVSFDRGESWVTVARTLLSRQAVAQVEVGQSPSGQKRMALLVNVRPKSFKGKPVVGLQDTIVYASDDGGESFFPFFSGLSMRTLRQMSAVPETAEHPSGWWIATSGGVWTNYPRTPPEAVDRASMRWARRRLAKTPSMSAVLDRVLEETQLSNEALDALGRRFAATGVIPKLEMAFRGWSPGTALGRSARGPRVGSRQSQQRLEREAGREHLFLLVQLTWKTSTILKNAENLAERRQIHALRRQIELAAQDAFHERSTLLRELAGGLGSPAQVESVRTRVLALEAILSTWMRAPLPGTAKTSEG